MVLSTLRTIALIVGIVYYIISLRNTRRTQEVTLETRQTHLFMEIYKTYASKEFQKDLEQMKYVGGSKDMTTSSRSTAWRMTLMPTLSGITQ